MAGLLALAFTNSWGRIIPRWILLSAGWFIGIFLSLYGGANLFIRGLMAVGVMATPESMHSTAARWHLLFWDPWWLLGGVLFILAVLHFIRNTHEEKHKSPR
ncbi:DUF3995 domain-containing protein [Lentibacillus sp. L22]|uniref:DUF3995 domain-containing protein n=1 Tax=Lentibacillus TaxID=175304 RepID=UPI0022B0A442|nr:DUF3995 domain-containing protein [Lentibacillus daqui]